MIKNVKVVSIETLPCKEYRSTLYVVCLSQKKYSRMTHFSYNKQFQEILTCKIFHESFQPNVSCTFYMILLHQYQ